MAGRTVLVTGGTGGIGRATARGSRGDGRRRRDRRPGSRAHGGAPPGRSGGRRWSRGRVRRGHVVPGGGAAAGRRGAGSPSADRRAGQQRRRLLGHPARHGRRAGAHLRAQPPRAVPADPPAARPAPAERPGARGHGVVRGPHDGPDRLRRPRGRAVLLRHAGLQPVQARQRPVHLRAGQAAGRRRRHRQCAASGHGADGLRGRGRRHPPAAVHPAHATVHEEPGRRVPPRRSTWRPRPSSRG